MTGKRCTLIFLILYLLHLGSKAMLIGSRALILELGMEVGTVNSDWGRPREGVQLKAGGGPNASSHRCERDGDRTPSQAFTSCQTVFWEFKRFPSIQYEVVEIAKNKLHVIRTWSKLFTAASVQFVRSGHVETWGSSVPTPPELS